MIPWLPLWGQAAGALAHHHAKAAAQPSLGKFPQKLPPVGPICCWEASLALHVLLIQNGIYCKASAAQEH